MQSWNLGEVLIGRFNRLNRAETVRKEHSLRAMRALAFQKKSDTTTIQTKRQ